MGIERIAIVDDNEVSRTESIFYSVEDAGFEPVPIDGPLQLDSIVATLSKQADAVICDHQLRQSGDYADFNGVLAVSALYEAKIPAILCTSWANAVPEEFRPHRRSVPVLISSDQISPETIKLSIDLCLREFSDVFTTERKPHRTLVRVEDKNDETIFVVVPGWHPTEVVNVSRKDMPDFILKEVEKDNTRFHAVVNIGAEDHSDLYFDEWEPN